jgi:predicted amidohydrolase YtcJ
MSWPRSRRGKADVLLANARLMTLDARPASGDSLAIIDGRIFAIGEYSDLKPLIGPDTLALDAAGGVAVPAFHDAHMHLLPFARTRSRVDCSGADSLSDIDCAIRARARSVPVGNWIRAFGYDEDRLAEHQHPHRSDLDAAAPQHPVRLQHRGLHLDVLNTRALEALGLLDGPAPMVERDRNGVATGRLFHAGELLHERSDRRDQASLESDIGWASELLLQRGITTIQDASITTGPSELAFLHSLADSGVLRVRVVAMVGAAHLQHGACGAGMSR